MFCGIAHPKKKITAIGYTWFYKTTPFLSFEAKKTGSNSSIPGIAHYLGCVKKQPKISKIALFLISMKLRPNYCISSKVSFPQRAHNCLLHSTTNHFFSFHLSQI